MINVRMQHKEVKKLSPKITVVGVGGAGGNAVNNMISSGLQGCEFVVCNTDAQALEGSMSECTVQLGATVTGGLGAGAKPEIGRAAAEETLDEIAQYLEGSNMAFITAGMGGGTGTGAAPVIAKACRELGVLTVGVVTKPFHFEGSHRMRQAEEGIEQMQQYVDTLIVIPNQNLFRVANEKTTFAEAFKMADSVLQSGVRGVTDLMVMPGLINLDFADIRSAMLEMGKAMMGTGDAEGERRAIEAAEAAINNPLLDDVSMKGARGVIINVTGGMDMTLFEVDEACNRIRDEVDPNANIIFGSTFDEKLDGIMRVSVVATGIEAEAMQKTKPLGGGLRINAITGQERKVERATPNTEASAPADVKAEAPVAPAKAEPVTAAPVSSAQANIPSRGPVTASAMSYAAAIAATKKIEEPESELFEQQVLEAGHVDVAPVQVAAASMAQQQVVSEPVSQPTTAAGGALRGTIYNDAFIPPKPAEPETARSDSGFGPDLGASQAAPAALAATPRPAEQPAPASAGMGLTLRPPVPGGSAPKKKTPSLFERFTSPLRPHGHKEDEQQGETGSASSSTGGSTGGPSLRAPQREMPRDVQQGSLNIDAPQAAEASEDELDIPAFLRRQAN
ncbi:MAG: cell division protein FtsZ [Rhodospirillales bacterium]|nr:cell division protein FtsZ [Rhodospirillales bacterium]MCB9996684.1 cell division protein FtsZ [Rhodospirillales bacterium]